MNERKIPANWIFYQTDDHATMLFSAISTTYQVNSCYHDCLISSDPCFVCVFSVSQGALFLTTNQSNRFGSVLVFKVCFSRYRHTNAHRTKFNSLIWFDCGDFHWLCSVFTFYAAAKARWFRFWSLSCRLPCSSFSNTRFYFILSNREKL